MPTTEIKLPELGENLDGGEVLDVKVAVGDSVSEGQTLLEIEAEKSTVEVPAPLAGRIARLLVKKGDYVKIDQSICLIEGNGEATTPTAVKREKADERKPVEAAKKVPSRDGEADPGERSAPENEAEPATPSVPNLEKNGQKALPARPAGAVPQHRNTVVPAGPATRRLARELGVDLRAVTGTASDGRVTPDDIKAYVRQIASSAPGAGGQRLQAPPLPDFKKWGTVERLPLDAVRRRTAEQMSTAWNIVPHVTQHDLADITDLEAFRRQHASTGPKMTVTAFLLKAAAIALKEFEQFNSSLDVASAELIIKRYIHIGVAVDTERGLLVPVIRDVDRKSVQELAQELNDVAERARNKKLGVEEMRGGTFTITNLGGIGGTGFSPIVNYPEVAILGVARARLQPVVREETIVARLLLPVSLSYDHRVIDGADAARFTRRLAEMLENPLVMLLHA